MKSMNVRTYVHLMSRCEKYLKRMYRKPYSYWGNRTCTYYGWGRFVCTYKPVHGLKMDKHTYITGCIFVFRPCTRLQALSAIRHKSRDVLLSMYILCWRRRSEMCRWKGKCKRYVCGRGIH